jgi:outer membrane autotransporter protein
MLEPQVQVIGQYLQIADANDGVNQIRFDAQKSATTRAGLRVSKAQETEKGLSVQSWSRLNVMQTFASDSNLRMGTDTFKTPIDGTQGEIEFGFSIGAATKAGTGWSFYTNGGYMLPIGGGAETSGWTASVGARLNW